MRGRRPLGCQCVTFVVSSYCIPID
ncbi:hypothetical protein CBM2609_A60297 [Cupriavidus taiwanensis]|nr:hypothetical protein CBM2604_A50297 [Cupriavidus taiwanensis]SOZ27700.1 hypothetical protein CBM2609_A60297 [Cupriavidus taiwanensis]SOZ46028.1 hypothetical protein CBM2610_A70296 [Cupriavidus taiwanensis]SPA00050.1 hypothetical protein CBM2626_A50265 [Cupriavidus taiwanensis]